MMLILHRHVLFTLAGTILAPALLIGICGLLSPGKNAIRKFAILLAPVGIAMWAAHAAYHALAAFVPDILPLEILLLDAGVLFSIYLIWSAAQGRVRLAAPWATLALALYATGLWILFQPMQMRGMM
jgi:hypothetical protein